MLCCQSSLHSPARPQNQHMMKNDEYHLKHVPEVLQSITPSVRQGRAMDNLLRILDVYPKAIQILPKIDNLRM
jgi:hypothetical protein